MTLLACSVPLWAVAGWRARQGGIVLFSDRRRLVAFLVYMFCTAAFAIAVAPSPRESLGFAFLLVSAWSDLVARKVYLPVVGGALAGIASAAVVNAQSEDALLGALVMGALGLALNRLTRGKGWGFGDVFMCLVIGGAFGLHVALVTLAFGFIIGAVVASALLIAKRLDRRDPLPMVTFVAAGAVVTAFFRLAGVTVG